MSYHYLRHWHFVEGYAALACEKDDSDEFICPTDSNATCDLSRCPLQGPQVAPIMDSQPTGGKHLILSWNTKCVCCIFMTVAASKQSILTKGHVVIGGWDNIAVLRDVDLFPLPTCSSNSVSCKIPDLPQPRLDHSLSLLPDGWLVVCGGRDFNYEDSRFYTLNTCYSWTVGKDSWTLFYTMRFPPINTF